VSGSAAEVIDSAVRLQSVWRVICGGPPPRPKR